MYKIKWGSVSAAAEVQEAVPGGEKGHHRGDEVRCDETQKHW